jgi:nicotinic acid mononucleotide adenylyltransferase
MKTAVAIFGRFNPPTSGHEKLVNLAVETAKKVNGDPILCLSHTQDNKKNPLDFNSKVKWVKTFFKNITVIENDKIRDPFKMVTALKELGYTQLYIVVGEDQATGGYAKSLEKWATDKGFTKVEIIQSPRTDEDVSATKSREAVKTNNFQLFKSMCPSTATATSAKKLFEELRTILEENELALADLIDEMVQDSIDGDFIEEGRTNPEVAKLVKITGLPYKSLKQIWDKSKSTSSSNRFASKQILSFARGGVVRGKFRKLWQTTLKRMETAKPKKH